VLALRGRHLSKPVPLVRNRLVASLAHMPELFVLVALSARERLRENMNAGVPTIAGQLYTSLLVGKVTRE
jgi:hypothetical protein